MKTETFVLIHGSGHGGWCFNKLMWILHSDGHRVFTPTLSGMGERKHLLTEQLTAQTHIEDIVNLIEFEELDDVILVGHSYAGLLLPAINEVVNNKIKRLVFFDAFIPENGKAGYELLSKKDWLEWQLSAQKYGSGWKIIPTDKHIDNWAIDDPEIRALLRKKLTPFSHTFFKTPIYFGKKFADAEKQYIRCDKHSYMATIMLPFYKKAVKEGWKTFTINTGHEAMLTEPEKLAEILMQME